MKPSHVICVLTALALITQSAQSAIVFSDNFDGTGDLNGTTPDTTTAAASWVALSNFDADGTITGGASTTGRGSATLAFTPVDGLIYTLDVSYAETSYRLASDNDWIAIGYSGFQGFQYECGVDPYAIAARRSLAGERLLFFAGLNVSRTLPFGTIEDVAAEIEYVLDYTDGGQGLFFFTSSSIGPEVPLENVRYAYDRMARGEYERGREETAKRHVWPWLARHPEEIQAQ